MATDAFSTDDVYLKYLRELLHIQEAIAHLHPLFQRNYPIAIVDHQSFRIYDLNAAKVEYELSHYFPSAMALPDRVRAAFPIKEYGGRCACVVTPDVFDILRGYAVILHEFVHCYQYDTCEKELKESLTIAQRAFADGDYMWEINYPFPYMDPMFIRNYSSFLSSLSETDSHVITQKRIKLVSNLDPGDAEYMVWQEWKEGLARNLENSISFHLGIEENHSGTEQPISRVIFYEGGARFITYLDKKEHGISCDLPALFEVMQTFHLNE